MTSAFSHARILTVLAVVAMLAPLAPVGAAPLDPIRVEERARPVSAGGLGAAAWVGGSFHVANGYGHEAYDPVADEWTDLPPLPTFRRSVTGAALGGLFYVIGGEGSDEGCIDTGRGPICSRVDAYNPATRAWTRVADMPTPRANAGAAVLGGLLYVVGGVGDAPAFTAVEVFNPATGTWASLLPLPEAYADATGLVAFGGRLWLVGGIVEPEPYGWEPSDRVYSFDPASNVWAASLVTLPHGIGQHGVGTCENRILAFGGVNGDTLWANNDVLSWDLGLAWKDEADTSYAWSPSRGQLTAGDLTMATTLANEAVVCPTGAGPWLAGFDLVVDAVAHAPASPEQGGSITLTATVTNRGPAASSATTLGFFDGAVKRAEVPVVALAPDASTTVTATFDVPVGGERTFAAWIDSLGTAPEWNDDNNWRALPVRVRQPDLRVSDAAAIPASPAFGEATAFRATVTNAGDGPAPASEVAWRLVDENWVQTEVARASVPALAPGESAAVDGGAWSAEGGDPTFFATADPDDDVPEAVDGDGHLFTVHVRRADLTIVSARPDPLESNVGDAVRVVATVRNVGEADAPSSSTAFWYDGAGLGASATPAVPAGGEVEVASPSFAMLSGLRLVRMEANADGSVVESSSTNNAFERNVFPAVPNLRVWGWATFPAAPQIGDSVTFHANVASTGTGTAGAFTLRFLVDGAALSEHRSAGLAPNRVESFQSAAWTATPGDHVVGFAIDVLDEVIEGDESDNAYSTILDLGHANLVAGALTASDASPAHGDAVTFSGTVTNAGDAAAAASVAEFRIDGVTVASVAVPALAPGASADVTATWTAAGGDRAVTLVADALGAVDESSELDNTATVALHVRQANLVVAEAAASPASPARGDAVVFRATVTNAGDAAAPATSLRVTLDGATLATLAVPALGAGESASVETSAWTATGGDHSWTAAADALGDVAESSESDNTVTRALHVREPDLKIQRLDVSPSKPRPGQNAYFAVDVKNVGDAAAGAFVVRVTLDGGVVASVTVPSLAAGATTTIATSPQVMTTPGEHTVVAVADHGNAVAEASEGNNDRTRHFQVSAV